MRDLDVRDLACPGPVIRLKGLLESGDESRLRLRVRDELARSNVARFASSRGASVEAESDGEGGFFVTVDASALDRSSRSDEDPEELCDAPAEGPKAAPRVVQVTTETMGVGDEELGRLLMRSFLKTQAQLESPPDRIVFYNGGVHLCCEGSPLVDDLRALEARGTEIIACGTCLNFFGRGSELRVGRVTDMLEIASCLAHAGSVVRP